MTANKCFPSKPSIQTRTARNVGVVVATTPSSAASGTLIQSGTAPTVLGGSELIPTKCGTPAFGTSTGLPLKITQPFWRINMVDVSYAEHPTKMGGNVFLFTTTTGAAQVKPVAEGA